MCFYFYPHVSREGIQSIHAFSYSPCERSEYRHLALIRISKSLSGVHSAPLVSEEQKKNICRAIFSHKQQKPFIVGMSQDMKPSLQCLTSML